MAHPDRRSVLRRALLSPALGLLDRALPPLLPEAATSSDLPPVRCLTSGPGHHWFGYYDKLEFDPSGRRVLGMSVDFEHRSPRADDVIGIGYVDTQADDAWVKVGQSRAWGWQQGCMLQWVPGSKSELVFNDREGDAFVCRVVDVATGKARTVPRAIYALSPDGRSALSLDFARVNDMRPGYGYAGLVDEARGTPAPATSGVWHVDLATGRSKLVLSLERIVGDATVDRFRGAKHWVNHILWNTDGSRFVVLHRWRRGRAGFRTRMLSCRPDGSDIRVIDDTGHTSHFIWRDPSSLLAWTRHPEHGDGFWVVPDAEGAPWQRVGKGVMSRNGHCTYLPGHPEWILNDTYPDAKRLQHPYLFHQPTGRRVPLGHFRSPKEYRGEWRCDTHPRAAPDGTKVVIDSPHGGRGRQLWMIDVSSIVS